MKLGLEALITILDDVEYKDWHFAINRHGKADDGAANLFVQGVFYDGGNEQKTREWYIDPAMTRSDVIRTVLALVLMAEEHEARERFRYKSKKIFGPHFDADTLVEVANDRRSLSLRQ